jgi:hypothetical protein
MLAAKSRDSINGRALTDDEEFNQLRERAAGVVNRDDAIDLLHAAAVFGQGDVLADPRKGWELQ